MTLNVQNLNAHSITQNTNVLFLSETWMKNDQQIAIPNFNCIAKFARQRNRLAGVAIYHNCDDTANILTPI